VKKIDFKKELKHLYTPSAKEVTIVEVPAMQFAMIDGKGSPETSEWFQQTMQALYGVSFTLKFMLKEIPSAYQYVVPPLEGLWWTKGVEELDFKKKQELEWTVMIMQPEQVTAALFAEAIGELKAKKDSSALDKLRLESFHEGLSAQIMHIGPYDAEEPTIEKLHRFIKDNGYQLRGKHHEIYLGDPRRTAPERLRTVLRQPVV